MTLRIMYDSDNIDDIPDTADIVMFYCDGEPGTATKEQLARFANKTLVPCTRVAGVPGKVVDIEPGCVWPPAAARPLFEQGLSDTAYFAESNRSLVEQALQGLSYYSFPASYDPSLPLDQRQQLLLPTDCAHQYASQSTGSGGHFDLSVVSDTWPTPIGGTQLVIPDVVGQDSTDQPLEAADGKEQLQAPIVDGVTVPGVGTYLVGADGGVFALGGAPFYGSIPQLQSEGKMGKLDAAICTILAVDGRGYTLVAEDGGTFKFGTGPSVSPL